MTDHPKRNKPAGKVIVDDRGNSIWDWKADAGSHALDSTTVLLRSLENDDLELAATRGIELTARLKHLRDRVAQPEEAVPKKPVARRGAMGSGIFDMAEDELYPRDTKASPVEAPESASVQLFELSLEQAACFDASNAGSNNFDPYNSAGKKR